MGATKSGEIGLYELIVNNKETGSGGRGPGTSVEKLFEDSEGPDFQVHEGTTGRDIQCEKPAKTAVEDFLGGGADTEVFIGKRVQGGARRVRVKKNPNQRPAQ